MVALITDGHSTDEDGRPFKRRRATPAIAFAALLALVGAVMWVRVLTHQSEYVNTADCNNPQPAAQPQDPDTPPQQPLGERVDQSLLSSTAPAPLSATRVRILNANGVRGQATHVASQLSDYGFAPAPDVQVANDPVYIDQNLQCQGQIRFGPSGLAAASAVWLIAPCAQLIQDGRPDDIVDLALGTYFSDITPSEDTEAVLKALEDGTVPDASLVSGARAKRC